MAVSRLNKIATSLAQADLLKNLPADLIHLLSTISTSVHFNKGQTVFKSGDKANKIFFIEKGTIAIVENEIELLKLQTNDCFGEEFVLPDGVYQSSAVAADDVVLLQINRQDFFAVLSKHHEAFNTILIVFIQKMYSQNQLKHTVFVQRLDRLNKELSKAKNDVEVRTIEMIKQEKLASLGLLSAGIAHELQNPLNFVNNFAELSGEIIGEIKSTNNTTEKDTLLNDVAGNIEKIQQHGMRASRIIKRIVSFSRGNTGDFELTNVNTICKEYVYLATAGIKSNILGFECNIVESYNEQLPMINTNAQDLGRVILNIVNNAFYALNERKKNSPANENYHPELQIITKNVNKKIYLHIKDNAMGIPAELQAKIFEPFVTTKPAGEGTGLGLSICRDIIRNLKGDIMLISEKSKGTEFIITLPVE